MRPLNFVFTAVLEGIPLQKYTGLKMVSRRTDLASAGIP